MFNLVGKALAQINPDDFVIPIVTNGGDTPSALIIRVLEWFLAFAGAIAVIYLIYGGILYITAGGDSEKATKGRTALVNAVIGVIIIGLALAIVVWVGSLLRTAGS